MGRLVLILLADEGRQALQALRMELPDSPVLEAEVKDADDMGVWVRIARADGNHLLLVRWDYILAMEFPEGETPVIGIKG